MNNKNITHRNSIEESRDCTTFEGSLQSKMTQIKLSNDKMGILNAKKIKNFFNLIRLTSVVHKEELIKWMDKVKGYNETVNDFVHQAISDKGDDHGRRKEN